MYSIYVLFNPPSRQEMHNSQRCQILAELLDKKSAMLQGYMNVILYYMKLPDLPVLFATAIYYLWLNTTFQFLQHLLNNSEIYKSYLCTQAHMVEHSHASTTYCTLILFT